MFKNFVLKYGTTIASMALIITSISANSACALYWHQPKLPSGSKKLRKF